MGYTDESRSVAWCSSSVFPNYERYMKPEHPAFDKMYELKVNDAGELVYPLVRTAKWKIKSVTPHRASNGRVEYFECGLEKESL